MKKNDPQPDMHPQWRGENPAFAREMLKNAFNTNRPVVMLLGAGLSADSGIPLASQLSQYLVQVSAFLRNRNFTSSRSYLEEMRWPGRHDLRIEMMLEYKKNSLNDILKEAERIVSQGALVSELRLLAPTLAFGLDEIFGQLKKDAHGEKLADEFGALKSLAENLAKKVPSNVAYRALLFHLCENSQPLIDACFDHFIRDRSPTTTHQFITFLTRIFRSKVIFSTNFDPLVERAFAIEGILPRVYEMQGEGTLPSVNMLMSQQLSIVKLHGGAHQIRTGFDLDNPLPTAVLSSFQELFDRLRGDSDQEPLLLVMGYSGSDRRVMDMVQAHIKKWTLPKDSAEKTPKDHPKDPCVLWLTRGASPPPLLCSAVDTHPQVLLKQNNLGNDKSHTFAVYRKYPAHTIRYRDARLFMVEVYQDLMKGFPISKQHYQAVNFVPHATGAAREKKRKKFSVCPILIIATKTGGGSSSQLALLADDLDKDYSVIWIDMAEVPTVAALLDVLSERICKCDFRLRPIGRPVLMQNTLSSYKPDEGLDKVEKEELTEVALRWIQNALRRGKYFIALDSMDEFPGSHPAFAIADEGTCQRERLLLRELIRGLNKNPSHLGDSRIGIALSTGSLNKEYRALKNTKATKSRLKIEKLPAEQKLTKVDAEMLKESLALFKHNDDDKKLIRDDLNMQLPVWVACCARRIRSEMLLAKASSRLIKNAGAPLAILLKCLTPNRDSKKLDSKTDLQELEKAFGEAVESLSVPSKSHHNDRSEEEDDSDVTIEDGVIKLIRWLGGDENPENGLIQSKQKSKPRWFYRIDGGYHWMHKTIRNDMYVQLSKDCPLLASLIHNALAEFCHTDLYSRSKDTRAFLEYLFHRTAAINRLLDSPKIEKKDLVVVQWLERVSMTLQLEKSILLTRVRVPSLISQLRSLLEVFKTAAEKVHMDEGLAKRLIQAAADTFGFMGDLLLSAGHPHNAAICQYNRFTILQEVPQLKKLIEVIKKSDDKKQIDLGKIQPIARKDPKSLAAYSDLVNAMQDPLLYVRPPWIKNKDADKDKKAWWSGNKKSQFNYRWSFKRQKRIDELESSFEQLEEYAEKVFEGVLNDGINTFPEHEIDLARTIRKRSLEFQMLQNFGSPLLDTLSLHGDPKLSARFNLENTLPLDNKKIRALKEASSRPTWGLTSRSARHECYRLCLRARLIAHSLRDQERWDEVWVLFQKAEGALNRHGDPADLQALAITRLLHADHRLRNAELLWMKEIKLTALAAEQASKIGKGKLTDHSEEPPKTVCPSPEKRNILHQDAQLLLSSIEELLTEGRVENRWRFQHLLTQARCLMYSAKMEKDRAPVKAEESYFRAGRCLIGALSNCGKLTDRRYILTSWWEALRFSVTGLPKADPTKKSPTDSAATFHLKRWERMLARLGVKWKVRF